MNATKALYEYIEKRHIKISGICRDTGLPERPIYKSLTTNSKRKLSADELIVICKYLDINPFDLVNQ